MPRSLRTVIRSVGVQTLVTYEWGQSGVTYNPLSPRVSHDPYPTYALLREQDPVHWSPLLGCWVCARYHDVAAIMRDQQRFSNDPRTRRGARARRMSPGSLHNPSVLLFLDPPDHARLRALVQQAFTRQAVEVLTPRIGVIMQTLLDRIETPAAFDLMEAVASPLPVIVIAEFLGVPPDDRAQFRVWTAQLARIVDPLIPARERRLAQHAAEALGASLRTMIQARRTAPREDLISALVAVHDAAGDALTEQEMVALLRLLLSAGSETTTNLIGNGMLALLQYPDQMQALRQGPALLASAIEEFLRYDSPVQLDVRTAVEDMEIGGHAIHKGHSLVLLLGSANRDPAIFCDPERLDVTRNDARHLSFGRGIHACLGAPLARLVGRLAFAMILERFPALHLLQDQPSFKNTVVLRGLEVLPVRGTS